MNRHTSLRRLALIALPAAALLLAGCSSATPGAGGADSSAEGSGTSASGGADDFQSWHVKYAECMQGEGIDYPTPSADPNAVSEAINIDELGGMDVFEAANTACEAKVGQPPAPTGPDGKPMTEESMREETLKLTQCLREQGVDIEDPAPGTGLAIPMDMPSEALEACGISGVPANAG
ncbi:hypothetical protein [Leucobacter aridicollis]|uniref:Secreted protein n=1 Tax=Leucobacter aridicollis TaxID=283878 RepID=A0A852R0L8_9MICO|nr:hypothetical protein [Leucobacter aridicollis]MBL3680760.1 hypothetical protein [Leucobacter aridicollis]NYD28253.1 hypothetical protein [Leucobacter aridicollis]